MALAFRSTRVLLPQGVTQATLMVEHERITEVREWNDVPANATLLYFGDSVVLPGLVDSHVQNQRAGPHGVGRVLDGNAGCGIRLRDYAGGYAAELCSRADQSRCTRNKT